MVNFIKEHKAISAVILANIIAVIGVIIAIIYHHQQTASIDIQVTPIDATISINGKNYENLTSHNMLPGDYHVVISMDGMQEKELDFTLENDGFYKLQAYLLDEDGGFDYYLDHPGDEVILENFSSDPAVKKFLEKYNKIWSIIDILPLTFSNSYDEGAIKPISISIRLGMDNECEKRTYCLLIHDYTGKNREKALSMIKEAGYNPNDYELIFKQWNNEESQYVIQD